MSGISLDDALKHVRHVIEMPDSAAQAFASTLLEKRGDPNSFWLLYNSFALLYPRTVAASSTTRGWVRMTAFPSSVVEGDSLVFPALNTGGRQRKLFLWAPASIVDSFVDVADGDFGSTLNAKKYLDYVMRFHVRNNSMLMCVDSASSSPSVDAARAILFHTNVRDCRTLQALYGVCVPNRRPDASYFVFRFQTADQLRDVSGFLNEHGLPPPAELPPPPDFRATALRVDARMRNYAFDPNLPVAGEGTNYRHLHARMDRIDGVDELSLRTCLDFSLWWIRCRPHEASPQWNPKSNTTQLVCPFIIPSREHLLRRKASAEEEAAGAFVLALDKDAYQVVTLLNRVDAFNNVRLVLHTPPLWLRRAFTAAVPESNMCTTAHHEQHGVSSAAAAAAATPVTAATSAAAVGARSGAWVEGAKFGTSQPGHSAAPSPRGGRDVASRAFSGPLLGTLATAGSATVDRTRSEPFHGPVGSLRDPGLPGGWAAVVGTAVAKSAPSPPAVPAPSTVGVVRGQDARPPPAPGGGGHGMRPPPSRRSGAGRQKSRRRVRALEYNSMTKDAMLELAREYWDAGMHKNARVVYKDLLERQSHVLGSDHDATNQTRYELHACVRAAREKAPCPAELRMSDPSKVEPPEPLRYEECDPPIKPFVGQGRVVTLRRLNAAAPEFKPRSTAAGHPIH